MKTCIRCGKSGEKLWLSKSGYCEKCANAIYEEREAGAAASIDALNEKRKPVKNLAIPLALCGIITVALFVLLSGQKPRNENGTNVAHVSTENLAPTAEPVAETEVDTKNISEKIQLDIINELEAQGVSESECYVDQMSDTKRYQIDITIAEKYNDDVANIYFLIAQITKDKITAYDIAFRRLMIRTTIDGKPKYLMTTEDFENGSVLDWTNNGHADIVIQKNGTIPTPAPEKMAETISQSNAVRMAQQYLDYTAFSRTGLIEQLEYEGFSNADAKYAVDKVDADWDEQAAKKAREYLDYTSFSKKGLIEQLEYEGFTKTQAEYGAETAGF